MGSRFGNKIGSREPETEAEVEVEASRAMGDAEGYTEMETLGEI